jgi:glucose-1-phosphate cytidylyltransferase
MNDNAAMSEVTAVLLCGGQGQRLRPFTDTLPKALVPLNGKPLLYHLLHCLAAGGVKRFVACVGYKAEAIENFLHEVQVPDWDITCVNSGDASMTQRLLDARTYIPGRALICYGDTLANVDLESLRRQHEASAALLTLTVYPLHSPFGIVTFDERNRIQSFAEKPRLPHWINIGFMLCEPAAFAFLRPGIDMPLFLSSLVEAGAARAYRHEGKHLTINTEQDRQSAEKQIVHFYTLLSDQHL